MLLFNRRRRISGSSYANKILNTDPANLLQYLPLGEQSGTVAEDKSGNNLDAVYTSVVLGQSGIGDGNTSGLYDGTNSYVDVADVGATFDGATGTVLVWLKMSDVGVWTDGSVRYAVSFQVDGDNQAYIRKSSANNTMDWRFEGGGTGVTRSKAALTTIEFMAMAITWAGGSAQAYFNGVAVGAGIAFDPWVGVPAIDVVGAGTSAPAFVADGFVAHYALWKSQLSAAQIADLASAA